MPSSDPCQERRLEQERQKREKYLQRKVQETLSLAAPEQPIAEKVCAHGTCSLTSEELKAQSRQYKRKLRTNRILQVRAQEMLFASQRIAEFRDRKTKDSKALINHLKEVWSRDQRRRIATLEEEYAHACQSIGLSHDAALLVERNKAAKEELLARQAEESRYWDTLRFQEAIQKEREQKELRERGDSASALRRKIVESVSSIERNFARRYNHNAKPKSQEKEAYGCSQTVNPPVTHEVTREKVYSKLAGFPIDFKDTYLHSRFDVLQDRTNRPSSAVVNCPEQEGIDAWRAAEQQRESYRCERARQIELERLYNEKKLERGTAAAAKLLNDQRIALLEQEVEEAFREEEREQDRLYAATNSGTCKRATSAGQQRRPVYTKHKVSKPLSCPGSVITQSSENLQERTLETQKKPKSLQDHPFIDNEKQDLSKIDIQGTKIQLVDLVSYQAQQSATVQKEAERELSAKSEVRLSNRKSDDGRLINSSQQQSSIDGPDSILEPEVAKSIPLSPVQSSRKGIPPIRASCERSDFNTVQTEEGNVMKQPRGKSPNKCPMLKQNADGSDRTGKRHFDVSKRGADYIAGPGRRWRSREKEREKESWIKHLSDKASPGKTRYHMELVQEAAEVEKEVEQYFKRVHLKRPTCCASAIAAATHQVTHDNGKTQRSQRDPSNGTRPPFISSGTIGYKKILPAPLMARSARPTCERDGNKEAAPNEDKVSLIRTERENLKALSNALRGADTDTVLENLEANVKASSLRDRHRPSSGTRASSLPDINKQGVETSRSWAHPVRSHTGPVNFQEQRKALKTVNGAKWANSEDQPNDDQGLGKDSDPHGVIRDPSFPRNRNIKGVRSEVETPNCLADSYPGTELIFEIFKPRAGNGFRKGNGSERQEKRVQEPKPRQKAVWKSYIDEKKQAGRRNLETPTGNRSIKSEPSSPPARVDRVFSSRHKRHADQQEDYQSKARLSQSVINPNARNCHTPAASVKSLPNSRSKFMRDKSVPRFWKYPQVNPKGIELEALENISTKMKSLSSRFHSPMTKVPQEVSPRRSQKDLNFEETNGFSAEMLTRTEKSRKVEDMRSSCEAVTSYPNENFAEDGNCTRKEAGSKSASNVADTLITAWKTGKFQEDYAKAMKRAKEITSGSCSSGVSKIFSDRNYRKPWLSKSPFRRIQNQEMNDVSLDKHRQSERSGSANPRMNHKSPRTCNRDKPWLSNSPSRRSPDRMMDDQENHWQYHRTDSVNSKKNNRSPMARSNAAPMSSPKRTNRTSQSQLGPQISKSSPVKSRVGIKETTNDPWEGQSLDFVLGSLAEQVRELDERIRSATMSSPALSSSSSLNGESQVNRDKQTIYQPTSRLQDKLQKDRGTSLTCSAASSPERCLHEINRGPPAAKNISRAYTNANTQDRAAGKPAIGGTYMDELKTLLREISIDNPSPLRRHRVTSSPVTGHVDRDIKPHTVQDIVKKTELLCSMNKGGAARANAKAELEAAFVSISANSSRACSVTSRRDTSETRVVMVENGRAPVVGNDMVRGDGQFGCGLVRDRFYANGNANAKDERERASDPTTNRTFEFRDVRETKTFGRRNVPHENSFREDNGVRRVLEKRLVQSRWTERPAAEHSSRSVQDTVDKRTIEVRSCAPRQVIHSGQAVIREQLVKEVVENGLPSPELHGHGCLRKNAVTPIRDRNNHNDANGKMSPVRGREDAQESYVPRHGFPNGKPAANENSGRPCAERQRWPAAAHVAGNGHKLNTKDSRRKTMQQEEDQTREYALSNGTEELRNRHAELPLWGEGSPHCSGSWRKGGLNSNAAEERMLLSGSVDFSPWNTAKLPDIGTPQTASEKRSRSKPPSPVAEDVGNGNLSPKLQRFKPPPQLIKAVDQRPTRQDALPNGDYFFLPNRAPVRESSPAKTNSLKSQARHNLKRPKPVPRGVDALWSLTDQDPALKPSATQNGGPPTRKRSPYETSLVKNKRRPASVPKSRLVKEQPSSQEEMPDSMSKSSQDDNYLPVIMAKDPESRQRVIERRRKALQLDMEHRQRLRNSRPSSARNSLSNGWTEKDGLIS